LLEAGEKSDDELMEAMAAQFVAWYKSPEMARGPGLSTMAACANLARDVPWNQSGIRDAKGCGAAMRVAPVALYYYRDPQRLEQVAGNSARLTHLHPTGVAAAVVNAHAVARVLQEAPVEELPDELLRLAAPLSDELKTALEKVKECEGAEGGGTGRCVRGHRRNRLR
jgi:ADP-ribosylglycohydrolase